MAKGESGFKQTGKGSAPEKTYTENKSGVRIYEKIENAMREFNDLSENHVAFDKTVTVMQDGKAPVTLKRKEMWDYFKNNNVNEFVVRFEKGLEKKRLKELEDYGYHVMATTKYTTEATSKSATARYYVSKKKMQYLGLDLKVKTYYKKGWKG